MESVKSNILSSFFAIYTKIPKAINRWGTKIWGLWVRIRVVNEWIGLDMGRKLNRLKTNKISDPPIFYIDKKMAKPMNSAYPYHLLFLNMWKKQVILDYKHFFFFFFFLLLGCIWYDGKYFHIFYMLRNTTLPFSKKKKKPLNLTNKYWISIYFLKGNKSWLTFFVKIWFGIETVKRDDILLLF